MTRSSQMGFIGLKPCTTGSTVIDSWYCRSFPSHSLGLNHSCGAELKSLLLSQTRTQPDTMAPKAAAAKAPKAEKKVAAKKPTDGKKKRKAFQGRVLQGLPLQGAQAGSSRHRGLLQGHEHSQLAHQRHVRQDRYRGWQACTLRQEAHCHLSRDPDCSPPCPAWRAVQACCF